MEQPSKSKSKPAKAVKFAARRQRDDAGEARSTETRKGKKGIEREVEVSLVHARRNHLTWTLLGLVLGTLLLWKLAIVGKVLGVIFIIVAAVAARSFAITLMHEPGVIRVDADKLALPLGLCTADPAELTMSDIKHAFFLRRAVPWTRAGPLLVIEAEARTFTYPRDWFASESDQRRILEAINHHLGRLP